MPDREKRDECIDGIRTFFRGQIYGAKDCADALPVLDIDADRAGYARGLTG